MTSLRTKILTAALIAGAAAIASTQAPDTSKSASSTDPTFTQDGSLNLPEDYRSWIWLSSGLGMSYNANAKPNDAPQFTNVFVKPEAYRSFMTSGAWPDKTMFLLEERQSGSNTGPNRAGHFQTDLAGMVALVKDEKRYPEKWKFFAFDAKDGLAVGPGAAVKTNGCFQCHEKNGAVDHTFVQFYPTLKRVALAKGTYKEPPKE